nr:hypothetical protein [uncultured Methanospirillum sp.]
MKDQNGNISSTRLDRFFRCFLVYLVQRATKGDRRGERHGNHTICMLFHIGVHAPDSNG